MSNVRSHADAIEAALREAGVESAVAITPTDEHSIFVVQRVTIQPDGHVVPTEEPVTRRGSDIYHLFTRHSEAWLFLYIRKEGTEREWVSVNPDLTHREVRGRVIRVPFRQTI